LPCTGPDAAGRNSGDGSQARTLFYPGATPTQCSTLVPHSQAAPIPVPAQTPAPL